MDVGVMDVSADCVTLSCEANYPNWLGAPTAINRLTWHPLEVGASLLVRLPVSALLPIRRAVEVTVTAVHGDEVVLHAVLPRGWGLEMEDLPPDEEAGEEDEATS
jgi:hypothetical protein